jgi:NADPH:quinone reductase-like Zn-dependent oxidoreductase
VYRGVQVRPESAAVCMSTVGALVALDPHLLEFVNFDGLTNCAVEPQDRLRAVTTSLGVVGGRAVDFGNDEASFRPRATLRNRIGLFGQAILSRLRRRLFVDRSEWGAGSIVPTALMKRCQAMVEFYLPQIMTRPEIFTPSLQEIHPRISSGDLELTIGARYPLEKAAETHEALEGRKTTGKIILNP